MVDDGRTTDHGHPISSPCEPNGSGELKKMELKFKIIPDNPKVQFACAKKYTRVNILRCVFILRCANQPESKFKLRSHGFYRQEYFCR